MWVRTVKSPDPSWTGHVPLVGSWVVVNRPKQPVTWIEPVVSPSDQSISYRVRHGGDPVAGTVAGGKGTCIATGAAISNEYIKQQALAGQLGAELVCVVADGGRRRVYLNPSPEMVPELGDLETAGISGPLPPAGQGLGFRVQAYGLTSWSDIYSPRQMLALTTLSDLLLRVREDIVGAVDRLEGSWPEDDRPLRDNGTGLSAYADAVVTLLAFAINKCASRWNSLAVWHTGGEKVEHVFRMQTVQMTWMYVEANPLTELTGGWLGQVEWISRAMLHLPSNGEADVAHRDARARLKEVGTAVVSTYPPYYDNVGYADLSGQISLRFRRIQT
jgi:putative DNA methylase